MVLQLICIVRKHLQAYMPMSKACHRVKIRLILSQSWFITRFIFVPLMRIFTTNCETSNDFYSKTASPIILSTNSLFEWAINTQNKIGHRIETPGNFLFALFRPVQSQGEKETM